MDQFDEKLKSHFADSAAGINVESVDAAELVRRGRRRTRRRRAGGLVGVVAAVVAGSIGVRPLIPDGDSTLDVAAVVAPTSTTSADSAGLAEESIGSAQSTPRAPIPSGADRSTDYFPAADSFYGGNQWVLPWGDGFVLLISTWEPEMAEGAVSAPSKISAQVSSDGLSWNDPVDVKLPDGAGSITRAISDGVHLLVGQQSETDTNDLTVSITTNLTDWQTINLSANTVDQPAYITSDNWLSNLAIGPSGWLATVQSSSHIDPWALLPDEVRNWPGGIDLQEVADGLSVSLYSSVGPSDGPMPFDVGEPTPDTIVALEEYIISREEFAPQIEEQRLYTWSDLGVEPADYFAHQSIMEDYSSDTSVWTGSWGTRPLSSPLAGTSGEGINQVIGTDAGYLAIRYDSASGAASLLFSAGGIVWVPTELPPDMPLTGGLGNVVAVEGGVLAGVYGRDTNVIWRGAPDGTGWTRAELPPTISENIGFYGESGSARGLVSVVDIATYSDLGPPPLEYDVAVETDGQSVHLFVHTDGTANLVISDLATGEVVADLSGAFDGLSADFARVDSDTVTVFDAEGNDLLVLPLQEVADALAGARQQAIDESGWIPPPSSSVSPELVVVATTDGLTWAATPIEDVVQAQQYPMSMGINGSTVAMRFEDQWRTLEIG